MAFDRIITKDKISYCSEHVIERYALNDREAPESGTQCACALCDYTKGLSTKGLAKVMGAMVPSLHAPVMGAIYL